MDQLRTMSDFFSAIAGDPRISITHIGLYAALLECWKKHDFKTPFQVFSYEVMDIAKISSSTTYHHNIRVLSSFGYINYVPSFKRNQASKVYMIISERIQNTKETNLLRL